MILTNKSAIQLRPVVANEPKPSRGAAIKRYFFAVLFLLELLSTISSLAQNVDPNAIARAERFMAAQQRGSEVLSYLHFGATYQACTFEKYYPMANGSFALMYRFDWTTTGTGDTESWFVFNAAGQFDHLEVVSSTGLINQPFLMANVSISLIGNLIIEKYQDRLSVTDRRLLQRLVDDADAKGLLEWQLRVDQALGT